MNLIKKYLDANPGVPKLSLPELSKKLGEAVSTIKAEAPDVPESLIRMSLVDEIQERQGVSKPDKQKWHAPFDGNMPDAALRHAAKLGLIDRDWPRNDGKSST